MLAFNLSIWAFHTIYDVPLAGFCHHDPPGCPIASVTIPWLSHCVRTIPNIYTDKIDEVSGSIGDKPAAAGTNRIGSLRMGRCECALSQIDCSLVGRVSTNQILSLIATCGVVVPIASPYSRQVGQSNVRLLGVRRNCPKNISHCTWTRSREVRPYIAMSNVRSLCDTVSAARKTCSRRRRWGSRVAVRSSCHVTVNITSPPYSGLANRVSRQHVVVVVSAGVVSYAGRRWTRNRLKHVGMLHKYRPRICEK